MRILEVYDVGANLRRILNAVWQGDTMVPRQSGFYGQPFRAERGVRVGDTVSPTIFNIVIDAVLRHWEHTCPPIPLEELAFFYIDDGTLTGTDAGRLQAGLNAVANSFEAFGLYMNASKTKFMVMSGGKYRTRVSSAAYNRLVSGEEMKYTERQKTKVQKLAGRALNVINSLRSAKDSAKCL